MNIENVKDYIKKIILLEKKADKILKKIHKKDFEITIKELLALFEKY